MPDTQTEDRIQEAVARVERRGYDAPQGDWIQNPTPVPVRAPDSAN